MSSETGGLLDHPPRRIRAGCSADLRRALLAFAPADDLEAGHRRAMLDLLGLPGDVFARMHFEPGHFTASAFVLSPDGRRLLLIHHGKLHRWLQPGGHIDSEDPSPEAGARREAAEETGQTDLERLATGLFDLDVHAIPALGAEPAHLHFDLRFLFRARNEDLRATSEVKDAAWFRLEDIDLRDSDASVMRALGKLRRFLPLSGV
jgi:8-oxo-dGTP pyrophosphatase MutT (NUDIX family)